MNSKNSYRICTAETAAEQTTITVFAHGLQVPSSEGSRATLSNTGPHDV